MSLCFLVRRQIAAAICFLLVGGVFVAPLSAQSVLGEIETLVFDDVVAPGNPDVTGIEIGPWLIASQKFHTVSLSDAGLLRLPNNGTPYIASVGGGLDYPITLERFDGSPFALVGFDAAEGFLDDLLAAEQGFTSATKIEVEAALTTGFTVTLEFDLDGRRDGPDGVDDFESFTMPTELHSVTSITFTGLSGALRDAGFALDNLVVAAVVPEPASGTLLAVAGGFLCVVAAARYQARVRG